MIDLPAFPSIPPHHIPGYDKNKNGKLSYTEKATWYFDYKDNSPKILKLDYGHSQSNLKKSTHQLQAAQEDIRRLSKRMAPVQTKKIMTTLSTLRSDLSKAKGKVSSSNSKYDGVKNSLTTMGRRYDSLKLEYYKYVNALAESKKAHHDLVSKNSVSSAHFTEYKINARDQAVKLEQEVGRLENEIESANSDISQLLSKIEEIEKNEETSLSQAVMNVRDSAFNTAFPNLGAVTETQSRGLAFFSGIILVSFLIGRIE